MYVESDGVVTGRVAEQRFVWGWRLHVGCWPGDCLLTFDSSKCLLTGWSVDALERCAF